MRTVFVSAILLVASNVTLGNEAEERIASVAGTNGLIAFWDFSLMQDGKWISHHDNDVVKQGYPVVLRRIGDDKSYTPDNLPYTDGK